MKKQKIVITLLTIVTLLLILMPNVNAALQSNGSTGTTQKINDWIINIRKMEELNAGMGLTETIGGDLTPTTSSNNLDVHMEKNTEYGAMAILSASSYGNPNKIASGGTTTGNKTGIVININNEIVAEMHYTGTVSKYPNLVNAASKYKNTYSTAGYITYSPTRKGDAIIETDSWHGSVSNWFDPYYADAVLVRAYSGSIFSYNAKSTNHISSENQYAQYTKPYYSRAAMICGEGI